MVGCSGGGADRSVPLTPPAPEDTSGGLPDVRDVVVGDDNQRVLIGIWNIWFDQETERIEVIPLRESQPHYNITNLLLPPICSDCLMISLNYFDPVSRIFDVEVTLRNPYPISGRDVRGIIYTSEAGHRLLNADAWTNLYDIPGGDTINPFRAFAKEQNKRIFWGLKSSSENFSLYIPKPPQFGAITFAADGCWMGNCREPYAIENFEQSTSLGDAIGSEAVLEVDVFDWQDDISEVGIASPEITGEEFVPFEYIEGNRWRGVIVNNTGALGGYHPVRIAATSPNPTNAFLYNFFDILIVPTEPIVLGIDPDIGEASSELSGVIVTGENFQGPGATVKLLKFGAPDLDATNIVVVDGGTITCDLSIPLATPIGLYDVQVTNGNGYSHTVDNLFEVVSPSPVVYGINPDNASVETDLTGVTITGDDFIGPSIQVKLKLAGQPDVSGTNVMLIDPQTITCDITISCDEIPGSYDVEVINDDGKPSSAPALFDVYCPLPGINIIVPDYGDVGTTLTGVLITGSNFICDDASVKLEKDGEPDIVATNVNVAGPGTISCDFDIPLGAYAGFYDVVITNDCGESCSGEGLFEIVCLPPIVSGCSAPTADAGSDLTGVVISGSLIKGPNAQVVLKRIASPDIAATNVVVFDSFNISCDISIPIDAPIGYYAIEVTNGCGTSGTGIGLIEITCPSPVVAGINPGSWGSYPYAPLYGAVITGDKFSACGGPSEIYLDNGNVQIYATNVAFVNDNTITCDFYFGSYSWEEGSYDLIVTTGVSGTGTDLFSIYDNLLYDQDFSAGDGGCAGSGTHGGYFHTGVWWDSYFPQIEPYPTSMYAVFMTPEFDVPAIATDVHFRMVHSIDTDIFEGAIAGWTDNDGVTFYGDRCDPVNRWYFEMGQNYNGQDLFSPVYEGMGSYIACYDAVGWTSRYWVDNFGFVGGTVWSEFHCTSNANLIGMSGARFMVVFLSDNYVENSRGHEIAELTIWYDPP